MPEAIDALIAAAQAMIDAAPAPTDVEAFFDLETNSVCYVVQDPTTRACAIIDSMRSLDIVSGRIRHPIADAVHDFVRDAGLRVQWHLETHVHADHLSAAPYLAENLGGRIAIGAKIGLAGRPFLDGFGIGDTFPEGFDHLFSDGERFHIGNLKAMALHVPGHTPADLAYVIGDAVFCGDTLFMPDYGTARSDFPGGDARTLYRSIRRLLSLPGHTRLFTAHDYKAPGREHYAWESSVAAQRADNVHVRDGIDEDSFVAMREARDATLALPRLILPSVQINLRAGRLPEPNAAGIRQIVIPLEIEE